MSIDFVCRICGSFGFMKFTYKRLRIYSWPLKLAKEMTKNQEWLSIEHFETTITKQNRATSNNSQTNAMRMTKRKNSSAFSICYNDLLLSCSSTHRTHFQEINITQKRGSIPTHSVYVNALYTDTRRKYGWVKYKTKWNK